MTAGEQVRDVLVLVLDERECALPIDDVVEVVSMVAFQPVPQSPDWLLGLANVRGDTVPVMDLGARFGLGRTRIGLSTPIVVVRRDDRLLGLVVDAAREVLSLPPGAASPPDELVSGGAVVAIVRHAHRMVPILEVAQLFDAAASLDLPVPVPAAPGGREGDARG